MLAWEDFKLYFWYIFGIMGVVFFWAGVWDGLGNLSILQNPLASLIAGFLLLSVSKFIFQEADPLWGKKEKKSLHHVIKKIKNHPSQHEIQIKYKDNTKRKNSIVTADKVKGTEKEFLVLIENEQEKFIPFHRLIEISHKGKKHWTPTLEHGQEKS